MLTIGRDSEIFEADGGWFHARWHFSFDHYRDPGQMGRLPRCASVPLRSCGRVEQRAADVGDVGHPDQADVADHRQVPETAGHHISAASRMVVSALMTVGRLVIRSWIRASFTLFPSATAWTMSVIGDDARRPIGAGSGQQERSRLRSKSVSSLDSCAACAGRLTNSPSSPRALARSLPSSWRTAFRP